MLKSKLPRIIETMERAGRIIGKMKLSPALVDPEARARAAWPAAAGKKVAERSRAIALVRGALIVEVEDVVWQRQLNAVRHFLLKNLREILGEETVSEIDFRPMPRRIAPQRAETARPEDGIEDPVLGLLYRMSKKRETA